MAISVGLPRERPPQGTRLGYKKRTMEQYDVDTCP